METKGYPKPQDSAAKAGVATDEGISPSATLDRGLGNVILIRVDAGIGTGGAGWRFLVAGAIL
jgi:hypothetical protein